MDRDLFLQAAVDEAKLSLSEGGIPIGSVLVSEGKIIGRGHNCRVQTGSPIDRGEVGENRNFLGAEDYTRSSGHSSRRGAGRRMYSTHAEIHRGESEPLERGHRRLIAVTANNFGPGCDIAPLRPSALR